VLTSLEIKNFRTFSHLFIERLGRVNLILGKNKVGKTTLLEALRLYASAWPPTTVMSILDERDEIARLPNGDGILLLHSLFRGRDPEREDEITIGEVGEQEGAFLATADFEMERPGQSDEAAAYSPVGRPRLKMTSGRLNCHVHPDGRWGYMIASGTQKWKVPEPPHEPPCLRSVGVQKKHEQTIADWWDAISLTDAESRVVDAMRPVALLRGVRFVSDGRRDAGRKAIARIEGFDEPMPLATLGDGVVRMFQIAVGLEYAAVYAQRAREENATLKNAPPLLLIDEVDAGIHHTLHVDLWRFIFRTARLLDVQVFATTHSWDCVKGFAEAIADDDEADGLVVRLERDEDEVATRAIVIDRKKLPIIARDAIEVR